MELSGVYFGDKVVQVIFFTDSLDIWLSISTGDSTATKLRLALTITLTLLL